MWSELDLEVFFCQLKEIICLQKFCYQYMKKCSEICAKKNTWFKNDKSDAYFEKLKVNSYGEHGKGWLMIKANKIFLNRLKMNY